MVALYGYSLPLSPSGNAAMITPPPWHFSGDIVMVDYRVDPDAARRFLPSELDLGPDPGAAAAVFAQWQWCSASGAELTDPMRCQFSEFLILVMCAYRGRPLARCPYAWVDGPVPMVRGWVQGMPLLHTLPLVHTRMFPRWVSSEPAEQQLVTSQVTNVEFSDVLAGEGDLRIFAGSDVDLGTLAPVEVSTGFVFSYAETLCHGQLLNAEPGPPSSGS